MTLPLPFCNVPSTPPIILHYVVMGTSLTSKGILLVLLPLTIYKRALRLLSINFTWSWSWSWSSSVPLWELRGKAVIIQCTFSPVYLFRATIAAMQAKRGNETLILYLLGGMGRWGHLKVLMLLLLWVCNNVVVVSRHSNRRREGSALRRWMRVIKGRAELLTVYCVKSKKAS